MPAARNDDRSAEAVAVARRYRRRERAATWLFAAFIVSLCLATYLVASLLAALVVAAVLIAVVRAPVLRPHGTVRLRSDQDPDTIRATFAGPTPPVLALQWGIADEVWTDTETPTYHVPWFFGLREVTLTVDSHMETTKEGATEIELDVTENGQPWSTYTAIVRNDDGKTSVDVTYESERNFGLRRLPQQLVARRYRDASLEAQGYDILERETHLR